MNEDGSFLHEIGLNEASGRERDAWKLLRTYVDLYRISVDGADAVSFENFQRAVRRDPEILSRLYAKIVFAMERGGSGSVVPYVRDAFTALNNGVPVRYVEPERLYHSEDEIPDSVKGTHLEREAEYRIKIRQYNSSNPVEYLRFAIGEGGGAIFAESTLVNYYETKQNLEQQGMLGGEF